MSRTTWLRRGDVIPMAICLVTAILIGVCCFRAATGQTLRVTTPTEDMVFSMAQDREICVDGRDGRELVIVIAAGQGFVKTADCPDQVCVKTGRLSRAGQTAACLPAGVLLSVEGGKGAPDAVVR